MIVGWERWDDGEDNEKVKVKKLMQENLMRENDVEHLCTDLHLYIYRKIVVSIVLFLYFSKKILIVKCNVWKKKSNDILFSLAYYCHQPWD